MLQFTLRKGQSQICGPCLELMLAAKVRGAIRKPGGIVSGDCVALGVSSALSSSACVLYLMRYIKSKIGEPWEKYKLPFDLVVIHVVTPEVEQEDGENVSIIQKLCSDVHASFVSIHLDDVFSDEVNNCYSVGGLLDKIVDPTGKEDMKSILIKRLLLKTASSHGCSSLLLGHTSDRLAASAISAAAKGQGYSLPVTIQIIDNRYGKDMPTIILCSKDVSREEMHCILTSVTDFATKEGEYRDIEIDMDKKNLNQLAKHFVAMVQDNNPGGIQNIMSSLAKLVPFDFDEELYLCPICFAPLHQDEVPTVEDCHASLIATCCDSCRAGIFGSIDKGDSFTNSTIDTVMERLPRSIVDSMHSSRCRFLESRQ